MQLLHSSISLDILLYIALKTFAISFVDLVNKLASTFLAEVNMFTLKWHTVQNFSKLDHIRSVVLLKRIKAVSSVCNVMTMAVWDQSIEVSLSVAYKSFAYNLFMPDILYYLHFTIYSHTSHRTSSYQYSRDRHNKNKQLCHNKTQVVVFNLVSDINLFAAKRLNLW